MKKVFALVAVLASVAILLSGGPQTRAGDAVGNGSFDPLVGELDLPPEQTRTFAPLVADARTAAHTGPSVPLQVRLDLLDAAPSLGRPLAFRATVTPETDIP